MIKKAMVLSDRIYVMNHARIEQVGKPRDLSFRPANELLAEFLEESNIIAVTSRTFLKMSVTSG